MTNRIGNLTPEELVDAMLKHQEMEQTHRYLNAGRRFRSFDPDELKALWILAVKEFWATRTHEAELELNNVAAELRLRRIKAPLFRVRDVERQLG
jgi:Ser/Thr protein kinase RdoA (MazF antagonist)